MRSGDEMSEPDSIGEEGAKLDYEPPKLEILGTLAELTQLGNAPPDELLNDGSQA